MLGRRTLSLLLKLHVGLVSTNYYFEHSSCVDHTTFARSAMFSSDDTTLVNRTKESTAFVALSIWEIFLMACVIIIGELRVQHPKYRDAYYLPNVAIVLLPALMLICTVAVRFRHTGVFGCGNNDPKCCDNIAFDATVPANTPVPGCNTTVNAYSRTVYCALPPWYNTEACAGGLTRTPDWQLFYTYGCSSTFTPIPYWLNRLLMVVEVAFVCISIHIGASK